VTIALHRADVRRPGPHRPDIPATDVASDAASVSTPTGPAADGLLAVLRDALLLCAELDPGALDARTPRGAAAVRLASLARSAAATLGAAPGTALTAGPGVLVVRDLAVATALLDVAARAHRADLAGDAVLAVPVAEAWDALGSLAGG
jgi:hypothetical protein